MRPSNEQRIETLRSRRAEIDAELARLQAKSRVQTRKQDTRRKILIGAVIMQEMKSKPEVNLMVLNLLEERLTKPRDRELFSLPCRPDPAESPSI